MKTWKPPESSRVFREAWMEQVPETVFTAG